MNGFQIEFTDAGIPHGIECDTHATIQRKVHDAVGNRTVFYDGLVVWFDVVDVKNKTPVACLVQSNWLKVIERFVISVHGPHAELEDFLWACRGKINGAFAVFERRYGFCFQIIDMHPAAVGCIADDMKGLFTRLWIDRVFRITCLRIIVLRVDVE